MDKFANIDKAAHSGANGHNHKRPSTAAQNEAGNYAKGRESLHGLRLVIENPRGTVRQWRAADGTSGGNLMKFHYGYIAGTLGNDGDELDVFIGPTPEAMHAYVVNQNHAAGGFDEHKIMLGFPDQRTAVAGYMSNYTAPWPGFGSCVACSIDQLKWWIANGTKTRPLTKDQLPYEGTDDTMEKVIWDSANGLTPLRSTLDKVLYGIRAHDAADGLLYDAVSMADVLGDADGVLTFDALVVPLARIEQRMGVMQKVLDRTGKAVKVAAMQVSDPFTQRGSTNVAVIWELTDGQTVTVFFHNPDVTPKKIMPGDDLVSWKWMLNKKDITVAVAPEKGRDLEPRIVAARIMQLAEKNSDRFVKANGKRAERMDTIASLQAELDAKKATLADLEQQVEAAQAAADEAGTGDPAPINPLLTEDEQADLQRRHDALSARIEQLSDADVRKLAGFLDVRGADGKMVSALVDAINQNHPDDIEAALKRLDDESAPAPTLDVDGIKGVVTSSDPMAGVPHGDNWVLMNAPRPLLGTETMSNGEFLSGRFYAAIDPADSMAAAYIAENVKLNASVVFIADEATQEIMALNSIDPEYLPAYMEMEEGERRSALRGKIDSLHGRLIRQLKELAAKGMPVPDYWKRDVEAFAFNRPGFFGRALGIMGGDLLSKKPAGTWSIAKLESEKFVAVFGVGEGWNYAAESDTIEQAHAAMLADPKYITATAPAPAADPEPETYREYLIYPTRVGGKIMFAVQTSENKALAAAGERTIGGDSLHDTIEQARAEVDRLIIKAEADAKSNAEWEAKQAEEAAKAAAARAEFEDVDGFTDSMSPMQKEKALKALNAVVSYRGTTTTRKAIIREKVAAGFYIESDDGDTILTDGDVFQGVKQITKTGLDYAAFLIAKRPTPAVDPAEKEAQAAQEAADGDFLALAAAGNVDFYDKAVTDRLAALAGKYTDPEGAYLDLINQAKTAAKNWFVAEFKKRVG
jgi:hypothetical protein